jgi:hypothetical protein
MSRRPRRALCALTDRQAQGSNLGLMTTCIAPAVTVGIPAGTITWGRVSAGFARVTGVSSPVDTLSYKGKSIWGLALYRCDARGFRGGKVGSMLAANAALYAQEGLLHARQQPGSRSCQRTTAPK